MLFSNQAWAVMIALGFATWPLVGGLAGLRPEQGMWLGLVTMSATVVAIMIFGSGALANAAAPTFKAFGILAVAGFLNGVAVYYYGVKLTELESTPVAKAVFVLTMMMALMLFTPLLTWVIEMVKVVFGANQAMTDAGPAITSRQVLGFAFAILAAYLLNSKSA
jgi:hypothetical protein